MLLRLVRQYNLAPLSLILLVVFCGVGCVSQKPLPYSYSMPQTRPAAGPRLVVAEVNDQRIQDDMDKVVKVGEQVQEVVRKEMEAAGIFREVMERAEDDGASFTLKPTITELRWEVPNYDRIIANSLIFGFATGAVGGVIYGSTGTDVYGYSAMHFVLLRGDKEVLNKEYQAKIIERKTKMACDLPSTYREVAAKALQRIMQEFKSDLQKVDWGENKVAVVD